MSERVSPEAVGAARILYFSIVFLTVPVDALMNFASIPNQATCSETAGVIFDLWLGATALNILVGVFKVSTICALIGLWTRWASVFALLSLSTLSLNAFKICYFNHQFLPIHLGLLFWSLYGSSSAFQIDSYFRRKIRSEFDHDGDRDRIWLMGSMRAYFCIVFFLSGVSKLRGGGWEWMFGDTLRNMLIVQNYVHEGFAGANWFIGLNGLIVGAGVVPMMAATLRVVSEILAPLAFFNTRLRPWLVIQLGLFQIMIYLTMYINFAPWAALYIFFLPLEFLGKKIEKILKGVSRFPKRENAIHR